MQFAIIMGYISQSFVWKVQKGSIELLVQPLAYV